MELENILKNVVLIEKNKGKVDQVSIGCTITIQEDEYEPETWFLVGPNEADPQKGKISHESPIGKALIGRRENDIVDVVTPAGKIHLKILKIE